jgi:hypothetical protein
LAAGTATLLGCIPIIKGLRTTEMGETAHLESITTLPHGECRRRNHQLLFWEAQIGARKDIRDEAKRLVESIARTAKDDPVLVLILGLASKNLAGEIDNGTANITQK